MDRSSDGAAEYGDGCAPFYDQIYPAVEAGLVTALLALAGEGPALDLGIGTGRVAIPLLAAGLPVHGVEASSAMLDRLRARPGGGGIPVVTGDFATVPFGRRFSLVYSLVSTFLLLRSVERQRACFENVAEHLLPGGRFVSEVFEAPGGSEAATTSETLVDTPDGVRAYRVTTLHTPLPEIDAMAAAVRLRLETRWSDWKRRPFRPGDPRHISVYRAA